MPPFPNARLPFRFILLPLLVLAPLLASCGGGGEAVQPPGPGDVIARVQQRNAFVRGFSATGAVTIETPELSNSATIELKILKPDSLLFELYGPFGVRVGKAFITRDSITFYNGIDNSVARGKTNAAAFRSLLRLSFDFQSIVSILTGTMDCDVRTAPTSSTFSDNTCRLMYDDGGDVRDYEVDLNYDAVRRFVRRSKDGVILEDVNFRDFRKKAGIYLPTVISIERPSANESLTLVYEQYFINDLPMDFTFSYPKSAVRIKL
jgi:outer membrane lipoprotein-sorting protein